VLSCDLPAARLCCAPLFPLARTLEADRVCTVHGGPQWHPTLSSHPRNIDSQATSLLPGFGCLRQPGLLWGVSTHESSNHRWAISLTNRFTNDTVSPRQEPVLANRKDGGNILHQAKGRAFERATAHVPSCELFGAAQIRNFY
jgi:hypothetical protein